MSAKPVAGLSTNSAQFSVAKSAQFSVAIDIPRCKTCGQTKARFAGPPEFAGRANPSPANGFFTNHETRNTAFFRRRCARDAQSGTPARTAAPAARPLLSCALWRGIGRLWRGLGGRRPPRRQHGLLGFHQPRITQHVFQLPSGDSKESNPKPGQRVSRNTRHETRITAFMLFFPRFPGISRYSSVPPLPPEPVSARRQPPLSRPPGCFRCGERKMNHAEKEAFSSAW